MSVSLGLKGKDFSIIAADTRATDVLTNEYNDDCKKLFLASFGWIAASGGVALSTNYFKQYLNTCKLKKRRDIYTYWLMSVKKTEDFAKEHAPDIFEEVRAETTSSHAVYSLNYCKDDTLHMGIETIDFSYGKRSLNAENTLIINPPKKTKRVKRLVTKYEAKHVQNIHEAVYIAACFMDELSKISRWVSNIVDCGISYKLSDTELIYMHVKDKAKTIKKLYKAKGDLAELMMVCGNLQYPQMLDII